MIELIVNNKKRCFNLKNRDREKSLFNTWYAMSDMPSHHEKKLRIITDKDETLEYKICEIQDCTFFDQEYQDDTKPDVVPNSTDSVDTDLDNMTVEELYDKYLASESFLSQSLKPIYCKIFRNVPKKQLIKIFRFTYELKAQGYYVSVYEPEVQKIVEEMFNDSDDVDITPYVNRVIEYLQRKKLC